MKTTEVLSFHPGRQHNLEQAAQINRYFESFRHVTSLFFSPSLVEKTGRFFPRIARMLGRRSIKGNHLKVNTHLLPELKLLAKRIIGKKLGYREFISRNEAFQDWLLKNFAAPKVCI